jgi:hypothetical protein
MNETSSKLDRGDIPTIIDAVGIRKTADGKPVASADFFVDLPLIKLSDGGNGQVPLHGVGPQAFALLPRLKIVAGRTFTPALHELIVGKLAQTQFRGLGLGDRIILPEGEWTIVGVFQSDGDSHESELLGDAETILSAYRRTTFNAVTVGLQSPAAFDAFKAALTTNPALSVDVVREDDYYAKLAKPIDDFLTLVAYAVGGIMGLGAVLGAGLWPWLFLYWPRQCLCRCWAAQLVPRWPGCFSMETSWSADGQSTRSPSSRCCSALGSDGPSRSASSVACFPRFTRPGCRSRLPSAPVRAWNAHPRPHSGSASRHSARSARRADG